MATTTPAQRRPAAVAGILLVLAILFVAVIVLANTLLRGARLDLTQNHLYTLSKGTREVAKDIDEPINLYFFFSDKAAAQIPTVRAYATRVREMLEEMASISGGKIRLSVIDPLPYSEEEDRATGFGLKAVPAGRSGDNLYLGIAGTNSTDGKATLPFLQPDKEAFLEYDVAKLVHGLAHPAKPVVGVISGLNMGPGFDPATRQMKQPWAVYGSLQELFELKPLEAASTNKIDDKIQVVLLVHPKDIPDALADALDQFVLRGGRLAIFVDPDAFQDKSGEDPQNPAAAFAANHSSDLPKLLKAWGIVYDPAKVLLDGQFALGVQTSDGRQMRHLAILGLNKSAMNADDVISAQLSSVNVQSAGAFSLTKESPLKLTPLITSSRKAMLAPLEKVRFNQDPSLLFDGFTPTGEAYTIAGRLTGHLKTAFPDKTGEGRLVESKEDANILLVADTDVLSDRLWVQEQNFFGQKIANAFANNGDLVVNGIDNLSGSSGLIGIRGRATASRPFTRVEALRASADEQYRATEQKLKQQLEDTEHKLNELQRGKSQDQQTILSIEQKAELTRFQAEKVRIRKELRSVRRQLDANIEKLGAWLKFLDIALIPILLTLIVALFSRWRLRRAAAA